MVEVGGCWGLSAHTSFEAEYPGGRRTCIMSNQQLVRRTTSSAPGLLRGMAHPTGAFFSASYVDPLSRLFRWSSRCFCFFLRACCNPLLPAVLCLLDVAGCSGALLAVAVVCSASKLIGSSAVACTTRALAFTIPVRSALRRPFVCLLFCLYGARSTSNGFLAVPVLPSV